MPFYYFIVAIVAGLWTVGIVASIFAFRWGGARVERRFWHAVMASLLTMGMGWLCLRRFYLNYSQTVNGKVEWQIDTRRFAVALLLLGALSLIYALWRKRKAQMVPPVIG